MTAINSGNALTRQGDRAKHRAALFVEILHGAVGADMVAFVHDDDIGDLQQPCFHGLNRIAASLVPRLRPRWSNLHDLSSFCPTPTVSTRITS